MDQHTVSYVSHINLQSNQQSPGAAPQNIPILCCWFSPETRVEKLNEPTQFFFYIYNVSSAVDFWVVQCECVWVWVYLSRRERESDRYHRSIVDSHCLQGPGNTEPNQNIKDIATNCVGDSHISQTCQQTHIIHHKKTKYGNLERENRTSKTLSVPKLCMNAEK